MSYSRAADFPSNGRSRMPAWSNFALRPRSSKSGRWSPRGVLLLPFRYTRGHETTEGALRLDAHTEPTPLYVPPGQNGAELSEAWAIAIIGAAELLCPDGLPRAANGLDSFVLTPTLETRNLLASSVVGHKRDLGAGMSPSVEASRRALNIGITLGHHETWVRPHDRGALPDAVLRYVWTPPEYRSQMEPSTNYASRGVGPEIGEYGSLGSPAATPAFVLAQAFAAHGVRVAACVRKHHSGDGGRRGCSVTDGADRQCRR
jgi:hypothetical protein